MSTANGNGKQKPKLRNHIAIVLDESGSMGSIRIEAIDAFNQQVKAIKETTAGQQSTVSLVKFNTVVSDPVYWAQPVETMSPIGPNDYMPNGMTAMLDAVGLTIDRLRVLPDADDEDTSFLVVIISDGHENNSKKYSYRDVAERIQTLDATERWTFTYLGANQDLSQVSADLHIPVQNTSAFIASSAGMAEGARVHDAGTRKYLRSRAAGQKNLKDFYVPDPAPEPPAPENGESWNR